MSECLTVRNVDLVFGPKPSAAFAALEKGMTPEQIQKETEQIVAVRGVNFSVVSGEILVLMGLSGSGKSSLLRCLNGMNGRKSGKKQTGTLRGEVWVRQSSSGTQVNVNRCSEKKLREIRRHEIAMVFQQFGLMPWKTVLENIVYPLEIQKIPKTKSLARALDKLDLVGLADWRNRYPHELSGGMQQRVGLARAFVTDAPILLMDEPFSALDPLHRKHLQDEVLQLQEKLKKTIIFVTHDFNEATRIANRIAIIDAGKILQLGTPRELVENPACDLVRQFSI